MYTKPHVLHKRLGRKLLPLAVPLTLGMMMISAPGLWGQANAAPGSDYKIEVLDVTTGSGSKTQPAGANMGGAGMNQGGQNAQSPLQILPVKAPPRQLTPEEQALVDKHSALMTALEQWHYQTMSRYNVNVASLADPFLPIPDVRVGTGGTEDPVDISLPPLLRLELSQLKLVAITVASNNPGGALASFEDSVGSSYILRVGDRIGRNFGRIIKITPSVVTVEERGRRGTDAPKITDVRLDVLSKEGLTIMSSQ